MFRLNKSLVNITNSPSNHIKNDNPKEKISVKKFKICKKGEILINLENSNGYMHIDIGFEYKRVTESEKY